MDLPVVSNVLCCLWLLTWCALPFKRNPLKLCAYS